MKRSMAKSKERKRKSAKRRNDLACFDFLIKGSYEWEISNKSANNHACGLILFTPICILLTL